MQFSNRVVSVFTVATGLATLFFVMASNAQEPNRFDNGSRQLSPTVKPAQSFANPAPNLLAPVTSRSTLDPQSSSNRRLSSPTVNDKGAQLPPMKFNGLRSTNVPPVRQTDNRGQNQPSATKSTDWNPPTAPSFKSQTFGDTNQSRQKNERAGQLNTNPLDQLSPQRVSPRLNSRQFADDTRRQFESSNTSDRFSRSPTTSFPEAEMIPAEQETTNQPGTFPNRGDVATASFNQDVISNRAGSTPRANNLGARNAMRPNRGAQQNKTIGNSRQKLNLKPARELIAEYSIALAPDPLPGQPVTLLELLNRTPVNRRSAMVRQYWETYYDWTRYLSAQEYSEWLKQIQSPAIQAEKITLRAARLDAQNQVMVNEIQLTKSQARLRDLYRFNPNDLAPLPSDSPIIKRYKTHYNWYARRGMLPRKLIGIDQVLPKTLELIANRAEAVRLSRSAMNQSKNAFNGGQLSVGSVLEAGRMWQVASQRLVASVTSYNQSIADYAMSINRTPKSPNQIVAMLISRPVSSQPTINSNSPSPIRQAANQTPGFPRSVYQAPSNTSFAAPARNQPPSYQPQGLPASNIRNSNHGQSVLDRQSPPVRSNTPIDLSPINNGSPSARPPASSTPISGGFNPSSSFTPPTTPPVNPANSGNGFKRNFDQ